MDVGVGTEVGLPLSDRLRLGALGVSLGDSLDLGLSFSRYSVQFNCLVDDVLQNLHLFLRVACNWFNYR